VIAWLQLAKAVWKHPDVIRFLRYGNAFMSGFIEGVGRDQVTLFPDRLESWIAEGKCHHPGWNTYGMLLKGENRF